MNNDEKSFLKSLREIGIARGQELLAIASAYEATQGPKVTVKVKASKKQTDMFANLPKLPKELDDQLIELNDLKQQGNIRRFAKGHTSKHVPPITVALRRFLSRNSDAAYLSLREAVDKYACNYPMLFQLCADGKPLLSETEWDATRIAYRL